MCMILYHPKGAPLPSYELLSYIAKINPHGFGIHNIGSNEIFKTTDAAVYLRYTQAFMEDDEFLIHNRLATRGSVCDDNCHPFFDEKSGTVMAHNGMIKIPVDGDKTDSQSYFEKVVIPNRNALYYARLVPNPSQVMGSRLALFMPEKGYRFYGIWYEHAGCLYSKSVDVRDVPYSFTAFGPFKKQGIPVSSFERIQKTAIRKARAKALAAKNISALSAQSVFDAVSDSLNT